MPYVKNVWVDEELTEAARYNILDEADEPINTNVKIELETPVVTPGTPLTADRMNNIEEGIEDLDEVIATLPDTYVPIAAAPPVTTAVNDIQMGNGSGTWITKTLAQAVTIIRTILDAVYAPIAKGVTNGDTHNHVGGAGAAINYTDVIFTFLASGTVPAATTYSACPGKTPADATTNSLPWPEAGVLSDLSFRKGATAQPATGSLVVTLYVNNVATALTVTITNADGAAAATFTDSTHTVNIVATDRVEWRFLNNASSASAQMTGVTMKLTKQTT